MMDLGILLGALGITLVTMLLSFTELPKQDAWTKSKLIPKFKEAAEWIKTLVPESMNEYIDKNIPTSSTNSKLMDNTPGTSILTPSSETPAKSSTAETLAEPN